MAIITNFSAADYALGDVVTYRREPSVVTAAAVLPEPLLGMRGFVLLGGLGVLLGECSDAVGGTVLYRRAQQEVGDLPLLTGSHSGELRHWASHLDPISGTGMLSYRVLSFQGATAPVVVLELNGVEYLFAPAAQVELSDLSVYSIPEILEEEVGKVSLWEKVASWFRGFRRS